jgi:integrase
VGKGSQRFRSARRRTVLTSPEFAWAVELLEYWCNEGRQLFSTADRSPALWPSVRGVRLTLNALGRSFTAFSQRAGLPPELSLHALRHSYTHAPGSRRATTPCSSSNNWTFLCVHDVALYLGVVGLQAKDDSTNDYATTPDGGLRWLNSEVSAFIGTCGG